MSDKPALTNEEFSKLCVKLSQKMTDMMLDDLKHLNNRDLTDIMGSVLAAQGAAFVKTYLNGKITTFTSLMMEKLTAMGVDFTTMLGVNPKKADEFPDFDLTNVTPPKKPLMN